MPNTSPNQPNFYAPKYWPTHFFFFLMKVVARLPYSMLIRLGEWFGLFMYKCVKQRTRIARINIQRCFPNLPVNEQEELVRENLISTGVGMMETAMLWFGPDRQWDKHLEVIGMEHLEAAQAEGKGGLVLAFHLTNLEVGGSLLGTQFQLGALYRRNENPVIEHAMVEGRKRFVHPIPREATRDMVKWIKNNGFVWYAADQDYGRKQSIFVPFFNISTATITATTRFAKLTKAPVIPMTQRRIGRDKVQVTLYPPLENIGQDPDQDARAINEFLEKYLEQYPEDYLWVHRRFKTRPNLDDPSFYPKKNKSRPVTPERYKNILEGAEWIEEKDGVPVKLKQKNAIVYFVYQKSFLDRIRSAGKKFAQTLSDEYLDDRHFQFQGRVRKCDHKKCELVYLEADPIE
ncbi:lysophospholipid acyltransferase family protein [Pleionea sediminis]|uniref:lysophospholipid acyltransferase family protein n=1 Tax=Pleionea sediminis TaxID=2569479 RepID=UPI001186DB0A|nr:LpxL/LpxP family Kdo(2)-lipid IV(A) lauroyl/palmitoleoyl acyltransferase [Pleionea sediminis]